LEIYKKETVDFGGDGKTIIAAYRASTGVWWFIPSSGAALYGLGWKEDPNDIPVTTNLAPLH